MSKRVFICNTVFQLLVVTWINHRYFNDGQSDVFISNHMNGGENIAKQMNEYGEFNNAYYIESHALSYYEVKETKFDHLKNELNPISTLEKTFNIPLEYDDIFVNNLDGFTELYFRAVEKRNQNVKVHIFEDGLSTYAKLYGSDYYSCGHPNYDKLHCLVYDHIYKKKYLKDYIKDFYLLTPELLQWELDVPVNKVEKINPKDNIYLEICNKVFGYYDTVDNYDKKYIFMEESFFADGKPVPDVELVNELAKRVGKDNIMVKIHPRNPINRFAELGYKTNKDTGIPWELICMNTSNIEDKILLTISSGSIINPIMIFGIPVKAYSLYDVVSGMEGGKEFVRNAPPIWDIIKIGYEQYYPEITICKSLNEIK